VAFDDDGYLPGTDSTHQMQARTESHFANNYLLARRLRNPQCVLQLYPGATVGDIQENDIRPGMVDRCRLVINQPSR
jgi:hypothetical protein